MILSISSEVSTNGLNEFQLVKQESEQVATVLRSLDIDWEHMLPNDTPAQIAQAKASFLTGLVYGGQTWRDGSSATPSSTSPAVPRSVSQTTGGSAEVATSAISTVEAKLTLKPESVDNHTEPAKRLSVAVLTEESSIESDSQAALECLRATGKVLDKSF